MKDDFWKCPVCETENPDSATDCETCLVSWEPDELTGTTHLRHLAASLSNRRRWRIADAGLGYVVVAARSRAAAEEKGVQLLEQNALDDQTVVVTEISRRGWLLYVRCALTPYPSALKPWQAETTRLSTPAAPRDPVNGRAYIGRVLASFGDEGSGSIYCADRRIGKVSVRRSDLNEREQAAVRAGEHVGFIIKKTSEGLFATNVIPLWSPKAGG